MDSQKEKQENLPESPERLSDLSPQKYGKAAYVELSYTPSKLVENPLYREAATSKKLQEGNSKVRQIEALNNHLQDRINQVKKERDCIEESLTAQIHMYKKLIQECEEKSQSRIKEIQANFKEEIRILIEEKEQQAKFAQSEKQLMQLRLQELQKILEEVRNQLKIKSNDYDELKAQKQKLDIEFDSVCQKLKEKEEEMKKADEGAKEQYQKLSRKLYQAEVDFKNELENQKREKDKEIQEINRIHRHQIDKVESKREAQLLMKNQQIKDLTSAFETEGKRLNQLISSKEKAIEELNQSLNKQKEKILEMTKRYENQINNLVHEKTRLFNEVDLLGKQNTDLTLKLKDDHHLFQSERAGLQYAISQLKDELSLNQNNFIREKDKSLFMAGDLEKQISKLRAQNASLLSVVNENQILAKEVRSLRELLLESSHEMQKCKEQFLKMGKERDILLMKIRQLGGECEVLHRIKKQRQQQAKGWRQSYYMSKY